MQNLYVGESKALYLSYVGTVNFLLSVFVAFLNAFFANRMSEMQMQL